MVTLTDEERDKVVAWLEYEMNVCKGFVDQMKKANLPEPMLLLEQRKYTAFYLVHKHLVEVEKECIE